MKRSEKLVICVLGGVALSYAASALVSDDPGNRYHGIVERNVFNLKPPAPNVPDQAPAPPPPKITLTGIFTILGRKQTGLKVLVPPKPPEPAREDSFILTEGQRKGDIEILQIDEIGGMVKVNNHGTIQSLNFTNDGAKLVSMPAMPAPPPPPMNNPGMPQQPTLNPTIPAPSTIRTIPTRTMRLPPTPNSAAPTPGAAGVGGGGVAPAYGYGYSGSSGGQQPTGQSSQQQLSPEETAIMIEVERERTKAAAAKGLVPPPPYTSITPPEAKGNP